MPGTINLSRQIKEQLPAEMVSFIRETGKLAAAQGQSIYMVGGAVRDLLLRRGNFDLDLVVEGDAIRLARMIAEATHRKITTHPRFQTAKIQWQEWSIDLATARSESYDRPGALPMVKPDSIANDLFRRDFTINAMAVELSPGRYGDLIDPYRGKDDLRLKLIRILHEKSFIDDATRIWRALRYEQRLDFRLEPDTLRLLNRDRPMLDTISGDRIRHELELVLKEEFPEKTLCRAAELGVLARLHAGLDCDSWLREKFAGARQISRPDLPAGGLYLALLTYRLDNAKTEELISSLKLPKALAQILRDTGSLRARLESLADPELSPSRIYSLLHGYSQPAIIANSLATNSPVVRKHIQVFLRLRYIKPALTGNDLKKMGIAPGPRLKAILEQLHAARLDGEITSKKEEEEELVKKMLHQKSF